MVYLSKSKISFFRRSEKHHENPNNQVYLVKPQISFRDAVTKTIDKIPDIVDLGKKIFNSGDNNVQENSPVPSNNNQYQGYGVNYDYDSNQYEQPNPPFQYMNQENGVDNNFYLRRNNEFNENGFLNNNQMDEMKFQYDSYGQDDKIKNSWKFITYIVPVAVIALVAVVAFIIIHKKKRNIGNFDLILNQYSTYFCLSLQNHI